MDYAPFLLGGVSKACGAGGLMPLSYWAGFQRGRVPLFNLINSSASFSVQGT